MGSIKWQEQHPQAQTPIVSVHQGPWRQVVSPGLERPPQKVLNAFFIIQTAMLILTGLPINIDAASLTAHFDPAVPVDGEPPAWAEVMISIHADMETDWPLIRPGLSYVTPFLGSDQCKAERIIMVDFAGVSL